MDSRGTGITNEKKHCLQDISEVVLEEVANSEYYRGEDDVPAPLTEVYLSKRIKYGRFQVLLADDEREIGLLPANFNYLYTCLAKGFQYSGFILYSQNSHNPKIVVKLNAK